MIAITAHQVDELADAYMENLQDPVRRFAWSLSDEFRWEWAMVSHFFNVPFYVYAYAFGQLLVLSLYKQYHEEGEAFKPRYMKILSAGGFYCPRWNYWPMPGSTSPQPSSGRAATMSLKTWSQNWRKWANSPNEIKSPPGG